MCEGQKEKELKRTETKLRRGSTLSYTMLRRGFSKFFLLSLAMIMVMMRIKTYLLYFLNYKHIH